MGKNCIHRTSHSLVLRIIYYSQARSPFFVLRAPLDDEIEISFLGEKTTRHDTRTTSTSSSYYILVRFRNMIYLQTIAVTVLLAVTTVSAQNEYHEDDPRCLGWAESGKFRLTAPHYCACIVNRQTRHVSPKGFFLLMFVLFVSEIICRRVRCQFQLHVGGGCVDGTMEFWLLLKFDGAVAGPKISLL